MFLRKRARSMAIDRIDSRESASDEDVTSKKKRESPALESFRSADSFHAPVASATQKLGRAVRLESISIAPVIGRKSVGSRESDCCISSTSRDRTISDSRDDGERPLNRSNTVTSMPWS